MISYANDVKPIVQQSCAISGCHDGDLGADLNWTVFAAFQSHASDVQDRITRPKGTTGHMPATGDITDEQIQTIYCWVAQGAREN